MPTTPRCRGCSISRDALTTPELLACLQRLEVERRRQGAAEHALINQLAGQACEEELGGTLRTALANRLHITPGEASRRIAEAEDLGERRALTGEPLPAQLTATAAAQREGKIGREHIKEIQAFFKELSAAVDLGIREAAEAQLAELATSRRPDHLHGLATQLMDWLHPTATFPTRSVPASAASRWVSRNLTGCHVSAVC